jgi:hypothetical protein
MPAETLSRALAEQLHPAAQVIPGIGEFEYAPNLPQTQSGSMSQMGQKAKSSLRADVVRSAPINGHHQAGPVGPVRADIVAKVFLGWRTKILRAADASYAQPREGPYRFTQNRSLISAVALKSDVAAEKSKDQLSRNF